MPPLVAQFAITSLVNETMIDSPISRNDMPGFDDNHPSLSRRQFLEAAGFTISLAATGGCGRAPVETALPFPQQPVGMVPGRLQYYASTCAGCSAACGLLVGTRDGRPLKMEGLPEHPISAGGLCAVGQEQPIGLYDSHRLSRPLIAGKSSDWNRVDQEITRTLGQVKDQQESIRFVSPTITSPTLQTQIDQFLEQFDNARHVVIDPVSCSAILDSHEKTHAKRLLPHYRFDRAEVVVSFGADFLGAWISPVEFSAAWSSRRSPSEKAPEMSYHVQFESRLSLTGSNADRRYSIHPNEHGTLVARLADEVAALAREQREEKLASGNSGSHEELIRSVANRLWVAKGKSLVICDSQDVDVQVLVNYVNHLLGNYDQTIDLRRVCRQRQSDDRAVEQLIEELQAGKVGALLVADVDLLHGFAGEKKLADAIDQVPLTVSFSPHQDEFSLHAKFQCPDHHALESWFDAEPVDGLVSIAQPTLQPLGETRAVMESLAAWSERNDSAYELLRSHWERFLFPRRKNTELGEFTDFWDQALHDGFIELEAEDQQLGDFDVGAVVPHSPEDKAENFSLLLYVKVGMPDVRQAHNPWLQELPDPVTKVTWDNYVCVSPNDAQKIDLEDGDIVTVSAGDEGPKLDIPVLIQKGQHDGVLAIALAYGCQGTDRFSQIGPQWLEARPSVSEDGLVGKNAAGFLSFRNGMLRYGRANVTLRKARRHRELAATQTYNSLELPAETAPHGAERREIIQHTTLAAFAKDAHAGAPEHHHSHVQLWPEDHPKEGHHWGMVVDLNKCTGCSACVIACQSENNVPVVGYDEVRRQREMHWIRIDRYYNGEDEHVGVSHQPMMCQHCDNAPCETVCPVLATVHSEEGLNEQVYNRCVGTRYCANNCPYKVRRFNWFQYEHEDTLQNLVLNPEVTVRSRGVMEKCSLCVQRIEAGKIEARSQGRLVADGDIQTACQQSCPANAIVFGDMNDPQSKVYAALDNPRRYDVLEELNVRPSVSYLRVVKNSDEEAHRG